MYEKTGFLNSQQGRTLILIIIALGTTLIAGVLAANQTLLVLSAILLGLAGLVFLAKPDLITLVVLFIIYTNAAVIAVKFHSVPYIIGVSIPMLLAIPFVYKLVFQRQNLIISQNMILLLGLLLVQLLGTLFSKDINISTSSVITFIGEGIILYFLIVNTVRTPETMQLAIWTLLIAGAFLGGLSFYQQVTGTFGNNYWGFAQVGAAAFGTGVENLQGEIQQARLDGPIGEKNYYAQIMLALIPLGLVQFQGQRSKLLRLLAGIATMAILAGIALTFSRGVVIGFVLMLLVMTIMRYIKLQQLVIVLVGIFLLFQLLPQYGMRLSSLQSVLAITEEDSAGVSGTDISTQGRIGEMLAAWLVFLDHPFIGVGPGMFNSYYPEYAERVGLKIHTGTRAAHNLFLEIAAELGLIGLLLFLLLVIVTLRNLEKVRRQMTRTHPEIANMATGFFLAITSYLATGLFLSFAYERYFWLILGLASALHMIATRQESSVVEEKALQRELTS
jgi:O-antigen ligase